MEIEEVLNCFRQIAQDPYSYLQQWQAKTGQRILGYFCINTPEELIQAAGFLPVRLTGSEENISLAYGHLQSYSCSLIQSCLEAALRGKLSFLTGTVFPHTCDSIQRLSDIWANTLSFPFHWDLVLPVKLHTQSARTYLIQELQRFKRGLEEFTGRPITDEVLWNSCSLFNSLRSLLRQLAQLRSTGESSLAPADFYSLLRSATVMDRETFISKVKMLFSQLEVRETGKKKYAHLFLVGSICDHLPLFSLLPSWAVEIVGDDLCSGWRYIAEDVPLTGNPIEALAERFLSRVPCPCKYNPQWDRAEELIKRVKACRAQGVVFLQQKFCDPHAFDYPYLKDRLTEANIPHLLLEIEPGPISWGGIETRLRAFGEALANK